MTTPAPIEPQKIGTTETGAPLYHYPSKTGIVVYTGPVKGTVKLADGTVYSVTDDFIDVHTEDHAAEVAHLIGLKHLEDGHPTDPTFEYDPSHWEAAQAAKADAAAPVALAAAPTTTTPES